MDVLKFNSNSKKNNFDTSFGIQENVPTFKKKNNYCCLTMETW